MTKFCTDRLACILLLFVFEMLKTYCVGMNISFGKSSVLFCLFNFSVLFFTSICISKLHADLHFQKHVENPFVKKSSQTF